MKSGIYIITNTENNKVYIGSTVNFQRRWKYHEYMLHRGQHKNPHLQRAWDKYGKNTFRFGILEYLDVQEELYPAEQFWADIYREEGKELYNIATIGPAPMLGRYHTEETRRKIGEGNKGKRLSKEHCRKIGEFNRLRIVSEETRRKLSKVGVKPYPAFYNRITGEVIPAGVNLNALCKERNLTQAHMHGVKSGRLHQHKGWELL